MGDLISSDINGEEYIIQDLLGLGTFGQVFRCKKRSNNEEIALKVIKNKTAYTLQGRLEVRILKELNDSSEVVDSCGSSGGEDHIVQLIHSFEFKKHMCLEFELLNISLLDILTKIQFRGLPTALVRRIITQILKALCVLQEKSIIHCDLKPENILLYTSTSSKQWPLASMGEHGSSTFEEQEIISILESSNLKIIDLGSACYEGKTSYTYVQSRFYRSPEVLLGYPYNGAIDLWSLGCVAAEMYLGLPIFPGMSGHNQITRIVETLGPPPDYMIEQGKNGLRYFRARSMCLSKSSSGASMIDREIWESFGISPKTSIVNIDTCSSKYELKSPEEFAKQFGSETPMGRKYLRYTELDDIIFKHPLPSIGTTRMNEEKKFIEYKNRQFFRDLLRGLLTVDSWTRWTAKQALEHPFVNTTSPSTEIPFIPRPDNKIEERKRANSLGRSKNSERLYSPLFYLLQSQSLHSSTLSSMYSFLGKTEVIDEAYDRPASDTPLRAKVENDVGGVRSSKSGKKCTLVALTIIFRT